jgi:hypothetical protein
MEHDREIVDRNMLPEEVTISTSEKLFTVKTSQRLTDRALNRLQTAYTECTKKVEAAEKVSCRKVVFSPAPECQTRKTDAFGKPITSCFAPYTTEGEKNKYWTEQIRDMPPYRRPAQWRSGQSRTSSRASQLRRNLP